MRQLLPALFLLIAFSCSDFSKDPDTRLIGTWRLTETLLDPGNGSGKFRKVDGKIELTFFEGDSLRTNSSFCRGSNGDATPESGTYSLSEGTLSGSTCPTNSRKIRFEKKGATLVLHYPCVEPCLEKYRKLK